MSPIGIGIGVGLTLSKGVGSTISYSQHLRGIAAKLATANSQQVTVGLIGNSIAAGAYANDAAVSADATWNDLGVAGVLRTKFATRNGICSQKGLVHPGENFSTNFTVGGGAAQAGPNLSFGLGGYRVNLAAATDTVSLAVKGRYLRCWGVATVNGLLARYTLDGGSLTSAATAASGLMPNGSTYWYTFDIDLGTDGDHTVVLQGAASGSWYLYAAAGFATFASGVVVHRMGISGSVDVNLIAKALDGTDTAGPAWRTTLSDTNKEQQLQSITTRLGIDLAILLIDQNNLTGGWTTYGYTLADVRRHCQNTVNALVGKGADVLLVTGPWRKPSSYGANVPFTHADVIAEYDAVAAATDRVGILRLDRAFPDWEGFNAAGFMFDVVHPSAAGHAWEGGRIFDGLTRL